jgi:imidazolonepropionase-like amidohydrolase
VAQLRETARSTYMEMFRRGVRLAVHSDAGIRAGRPHNVLPHGVSFAGLDMNNADALRAVTEHPAAACGLAGRKGRLATGYDADLVAFVGHPLFDITALLRPTVVIRAGTAVPDHSGQPLARWLCDGERRLRKRPRGEESR